jgi:FAD binding domain
MDNGRISVLYLYLATLMNSLADPGSTVWEFRTNNTCLPTTDPTTSCTRGNYPVYVINATSTAHIQIGVIFARLFNIRLIIKNTGHDFLGKSLGFGSLSIWTHQFQDVNFISKYSGVGGYTGTAVQLGAGVNTRDIYQQANAKGVVIVGGECEVIFSSND